MTTILLADDDADVRHFVGGALRDAGYTVIEAADGASAADRVTKQPLDILVCDVRMPGMSGLEVFRTARREAPGLDVILMTSFADARDAVASLKEGARDYLVKPVDTEELKIRVRHVEEVRALRAAVASASAGGGGVDLRVTILGDSPVAERLRARISAGGPSDAPVLITGESGTGKSVAARAIHDASARRNGPFVEVVCGAFPDLLIDRELFGAEDPSGEVRPGRIAAAKGGTLVLDDVGALPLSTQAKLLRVLQEGVFEPVGSSAEVPCEARILSTASRDLKRAIADGEFREDLYFRLNVVKIHMPPLRERAGDLSRFVRHFLEQRTPAGNPLPEVSLRAWAALSQYPFPGNVRELAHAIDHATSHAAGAPIDLSHLPDDIAHAGLGLAADAAPLQPLEWAMKRCERDYLIRALTQTGGKRVRAAELLGISRKNLWEKLKSHGITDSDIEE